VKVDSTESWLSALPEHWQTKRLKYVGKAVIGLTYSPDDIVGDSEGTPVFRANNLQNNKIDLQNLVYVSMKIPQKLRVRSGDIVICSRNGSRALIGKNATAKIEHEGMSFGAFTTVFRSQHSRYVGWVLNSKLFEYQAGAYLTTTINQLTTGTLNNFEIPFPSEPEQFAIADFLDRETARIDQLIDTKRRMAEVLAEKADAIITHLTFGQHFSTKFEQNKVAWMPDLPRGWIIQRLARQFINLDYRRIPLNSEERAISKKCIHIMVPQA
jgi:type I restriction enzyme, S subunit